MEKIIVGYRINDELWQKHLTESLKDNDPSKVYNIPNDIYEPVEVEIEL